MTHPTWQLLIPPALVVLVVGSSALAAVMATRERKARSMPRIRIPAVSLPAALQSAACVGLAALAFLVWTVREDGPLSAHASAQRPSPAGLDLVVTRTVRVAQNAAYVLTHPRAGWRVANGWTVAYSVPAHDDESPVCAPGRYFNPTRVAVGRRVVRGHWNATHDRLVYAGPRNPNDEARGSVLFDGVRLWNGTGQIVTLEGACLT